MLESTYQSKLIKKLERLFVGSVVLKNDTEYRQGIPDLLLLCNGFWAALEVKRSWDAPVRPNQEYYVELLDRMSFAAFIYPENEEDVLDALQRAYEAYRNSRGFEC